MKNFINIRLETYNQEKTKNDLKHNFRIIKSLSQENNNINYYFDKEGKQREGESFYEIIKDTSQRWKNELNEKTYQRTKRNIRNSRTHLISGVITFSEQQEFNFKNDKLDITQLVKNCKKTLDEICEKYKTKILYFVLHLDEKSPHFHFHLSNSDQEGYSIFKKIKTKENLSDLQDIAYENFKNMEMKRGIKKDSSQKPYDYKSIQKFHEEERKKIREEIKELRDLYKSEKERLRDEKNLLIDDTTYTKDEKKEKYKLINENIKNVILKEKQDMNSLQEKLQKLQKIEVDDPMTTKPLKQKKEVLNEFRDR